MKKVLVTVSAFAMALSLSATSFADTLLLPVNGCCGAAAPISFYQNMPCCQQKRSFSYYAPIQKSCPVASRCCGAAAPVEPCCETAKPCPCKGKCPLKMKKHKKAKKCNCSLK